MEKTKGQTYTRGLVSTVCRHGGRSLAGTFAKWQKQQQMRATGVETRQVVRPGGKLGSHRIRRNRKWRQNVCVRVREEGWVRASNELNDDNDDEEETLAMEKKTKKNVFKSVEWTLVLVYKLLEGAAESAVAKKVEEEKVVKVIVL